MMFPAGSAESHQMVETRQRTRLYGESGDAACFGCAWATPAIAHAIEKPAATVDAREREISCTFFITSSHVILREQGGALPARGSPFAPTAPT